MKSQRLAKKLSALALALVLCLSLLPGTARAADSAKFAVMSTSDIHGKIWEQNLLTDGAESRNLLRVATAVNQARETYGEDNVIVVDNGDLYQGTPVSFYHISRYTAGETTDPNPMAVALGYIGYTAATLGNHEFNYSWSTMSDIYAYLEEQGVATIACNLYYEKDDGDGHKAGQRVFSPYIVQEIAVGGETFRVGIIGVENTDCDRWDSPERYPNILFASPDNETRDLAVEVNKAIGEMKENGDECDFVIVSYHGGLGSAEDGLVLHQNTEGQAARIIANTTEVDMVIAGHDHSNAYSNTSYPNQDGSKEVLVVNAGGTDLTNTVFEVTCDAAGDFSVTCEVSENLALKDYEPDPELTALIQPYADAAVEFVNAPIGVLEDGWDAGFTTYSNNAYYVRQSDTIDLANRAQMAMGTQYLNEKYAGVDELNARLREIYGEDTGKQYHGEELTVDLSCSAVVTARETAGGELSMKGVYGFYRYDNNALVLLALSGQEILDLLEYNASTRLQARISNGEVIYSIKGDSNAAFTNPVFYGINFVYDMAQPEGSRVQIEGLANGKAFDPEETYLLAINDYHLGNAANEELGKYTIDQALWTQAGDLGGGGIPDLIADYVTMKTEADGMVYTTANAEKNGETPSHWALTYSGEITAPAVDDAAVYAGQSAAEIADGDQVMIYSAPAFGVISREAAENKLSVLECEVIDGTVYATEQAAVMTVGVSDKGYTFQGQDGYLAVDGGLIFAGELGDTCYWSVEKSEKAEGAYILTNTASDRAVEFYGGLFTTYEPGDSDIYQMQFFRVSGMAGLADGLADGDEVAFYYPAGGQVVTSTADGSKLTGVEHECVDTKGGGSVLALPAGAGVYTVEATEDGYYRFKTEDGYLTSGETGNSLAIGELTEGLSDWELEETEGGFLLRSVGANYNGNYNQYLEYYGGFTTYGLKDGGDRTIYTFRIYKVGAASVIPEKAEEPAEPAEPAEPVEISFTDVTEANWHYEFVMKMAAAGIVNGYADGSFQPGTAVKWGEALKMVMSFAGYEDQPSVEGGTWASGWIAKAQEDGLVEGEVDQNAVITRAELCEVLAKAEKIAASENESAFADTDNGYVQALVDLGVIGGMPDGTFQPDGELTRAQLCKILATFPAE